MPANGMGKENVYTCKGIFFSLKQEGNPFGAPEWCRRLGVQTLDLSSGLGLKVVSSGPVPCIAFHDGHGDYLEKKKKKADKK